MKNKYYFIIFISILLLGGNCGAQITFQRSISAPSPGCVANAIQITNDVGYIVIGYYGLPGLINSDIYLVKLNSEGDTLWAKTYTWSPDSGGIYDAVGYSVQQTKDGGYIIAGTIDSLEQTTGDLYIIKTDANGDTLWTKAYGGIIDSVGDCIEQTNDSGYIISGLSSSGNVYLIKTNAYGDTSWTKMYSGGAGDQHYCVKQTSDSGYIICCSTKALGAGLNDVYLIKTNAVGDTLWTKTYGGLQEDYGYAVVQTFDGGYIITGSTTSFGIGYENIYLIKTDASGNAIWTKTYSGTNYDQGYDVQQTSDSGYIICGSTTSFGAGNGDVCLIKTDANGDTLWTKTYGGTDVDQGNSVKQTNDGGYIIAGVTLSFVSLQNFEGFYIIKTDANGNSGCNQGNTNTFVSSTATQVGSANAVISSGGTIIMPTATITGSIGSDSSLCAPLGIMELTDKNTISIYPNPATDQFTVYGLQVTGSASTLTIYNMLGSLIYTEAINSKQETVNPPKDGSAVVDCKLFSPGIYFVKIADENEQWVGKFVKE